MKRNEQLFKKRIVKNMMERYGQDLVLKEMDFLMENDGELSDWEADFINDMKTKDNYTAKQYEKIIDIYNTIFKKIKKERSF